jgi:glucose/arabinose dehydrogenase
MLRVACVIALALALAGCMSDGGEDDAGPRIMTRDEAPATETGTSTAPVGVPAPGELRLEQVATGFASPVHATAAPGEPNRIYVVEQEGVIRVIENGTVRPQPFVELTSEIASGGEQGLLSVAFHPDYTENGRLYVDYTNLEGDTRVVELRANAERTAADPSTARELLAIEQPFSNHNGGQLAFGPDGRLYVGMGDGGSGGDPDNRAQDLGDRLGKLLALDMDAGGADWEVVAYGLRNPWRFSFDRETGNLLIGDVGQDSREEVDLVRWPADGLPNFGWPTWEGDVQYSDRPLRGDGRLVEPVLTYGRDDGCSITGGFVYRGSAIPGLDGRGFFGDYCSGQVWSFQVDGVRARDLRREQVEVPGLTSFGEDSDGELLLVSEEGTVFRLVGSR